MDFIGPIPNPIAIGCRWLVRTRAMATPWLVSSPATGFYNRSDNFICTHFIFKRFLLLVVFIIAAFVGKAQNVFFADAPENSFIKPVQKRVIIPGKYRTVKLYPSAILPFLKELPSEQNIANYKSAPVMDIPMPDGAMAKFHVWESSVMAPELAAAYPGIKTFSGQGIDDPTATIKFDWTEFGFHAMILSPLTGSVFIDPYDQQTLTNYISYYKTDAIKLNDFIEQAPIQNPKSANQLRATDVLAGVCIGTELRTYKLAIACTHEYAIAATALANPTIAQALAKITTTINRVDGVYEKELSIRMVLIATENAVIFTSAATDPFTGNSDPTKLIDESQAIIDARIGAANYDIGHTFSTGGGGAAVLGVVCGNGQKASGITGASNPTGDAYDIDYVAHEMGHQFGANHTFNSFQSNCGGNGAATSNTEPGSGSTIMAYAGICGSTDNLQAHTDAYFNAVSLNEITTYIINGNGNGCVVKSPTTNNPPNVNAGPDFIIPKSTPFILSGGATDVDGDALTFCWEQIDVGGPFGSWNNPTGDAPLFRSFLPAATPVRFFPRVSDVVTNATTKGELLPSYARALHFRLTARDNHTGGGGVCFDEAAVTVSGTAGPFIVTYPNANGITWLANDFKTITWDVAGTAVSPINCSSVNIQLSTDGGNTFPITIATNTPNDGAEEIQVPANITASARIRVSAAGNVFYDISNANFSIQNPSTSEFVFNSPLPGIACGGNSVAINLMTASFNGFFSAINLTATGNPAGTSVTFGNSPLLPGSATTVTLSSAGALASGNYNVTVNGVAGSVNKTRVISFVINTPVAPSSLTSPANNATGISTLPVFNWAPVAAANSYTMEISTSNTFASIIQTITGITAIPTVLITPLADNTAYYWRVITVNGCGSSAASDAGTFKTGAAVQLCPRAASTSFTSNLTGAAYQWQVNTGSGFTNLFNNANYTGTNTATLGLINLPSAWNGYQYRCVADGNNSNLITISFTNFWNGSVSTAWENTANWSCGALPDANTDVIINSRIVVVNSIANCRSITVNPGASVTVNAGFKITVTH